MPSTVILEARHNMLHFAKKKMRLSFSSQCFATRPCPEAWYGICQLAIKPGPVNKQINVQEPRVSVSSMTAAASMYCLFSCLNRWAGLGGLLLAGEVSVGIVRRLVSIRKAAVDAT